jgi:hypothetical protein
MVRRTSCRQSLLPKGEGRAGNHRTASALPQERRCVQLSEHLHYAGLNAHALAKFGSLEVRTLRGCTDPQTILDWVGILERLYTSVGDFTDPRDICSLFSSEGPLAFFDNVLRETGIGRRSIGYNDEQIRDAMYDGIRLAQDLCYCRDWSEYNPIKLRPDPSAEA